MAAPLARADLPDDARVLVDDRVAVGVAADGSFTNAALALGLLFDPDGPAGPMPVGGDAILPGRDFEAWGLQDDAGTAWVQSAGDLGSTVALDWEAADEGTVQVLIGRGGDETAEVELRLSLPVGASVLRVDLTVEARQEMPGLRVSRSFDPDTDHWASGSYDTDNDATQPGVVVAAAGWDGRAWALAAADGAGAVCAWCVLPAEIAAGDDASTGDDQLGMVVELGSLAAGESATAHFAYAFGPDAETARARAAAAVAVEDADLDGVADADDCAPLDARAFPGAAEALDGLDNDCDGATDETAGLPDGGEPLPDDWDTAPPWDTGGPDAAGAADKPAGGGCAVAPTPRAALLALLLPALASACRRRSPR